MVWSDQVGTSIVVPSDRIDGDGRNYIVIGEDVPPEIADDFTAALVFRSGSYDPNAPHYPNGFAYWAFGISSATAALETVAYYYVTPTPGAKTAQYFRQTVQSLSPPIGIDKPAITALGGGEFGSYNEGSNIVVAEKGIFKSGNGGPYLAMNTPPVGSSYLPATTGSPDMPPNTLPIIQAFYMPATSNAGGDFNIIFPTPFPNGISSVQVTSAHEGVWASTWPKGGDGGLGAPSLSRVSGRCSLANANLAFHVIAIGW